MHFTPLVDTERVAFRHREGDTYSYENEGIRQCFTLRWHRCSEDLAALHPDRAREARRPPSPPSNGAPDRR